MTRYQGDNGEVIYAVNYAGPGARVGAQIGHVDRVISTGGGWLDYPCHNCHGTEWKNVRITKREKRATCAKCGTNRIR